MSQTSKKSKSLTRKNNNDIKKKETWPSTHFLSIKHEKQEDDSLISLDTSIKCESYSTNPKKDIEVSFKRENCPLSNYMCIEDELQDGKAQTIESKTIFQDETEIGESSMDVFSFNNGEHNNILEDTSLIFKDVNDYKDNKSTSCHVRNKPEDHDSKMDVISFSDNDDDVLITDQMRNKTNLPTNNDMVGTTEESDNEHFNQCPICFKTVTKYINHLKLCASKNNLTTQQLLSVLKLHKKQLAERKELGLRPPGQSFRAKVSPKRSRGVDKKRPIDSNLQLAMALSASLRSAEENELIQEAEALKEAGLSDEADKKLSTLEKFGFASNFPSHVQGSSKSRWLAPSLLLKRTKEDRERIVTEKVAIILINEEESFGLDTFVEKIPTVKSKRLSKLWMEDCVLWSKAHCPSEEQRSSFYIQALSEFIEPSTAEVGEGLRRLSQLPGRLNTPAKWDMAEPSTPTQVQSFSAVKKSLSSASTIRRCSTSPNKTNQLSKDWRSLVGNSVLSDISVHCDNGHVVPAHKLVFHVRCPTILNFTVKNDGGQDVIILENCSKESVLAFLEFLYSGSCRNMLYLSPQEFESIVSLANKFNHSELQSELVTLSRLRENIPRNSSWGKEVKKELFGDHMKTRNNVKHEKNYNLTKENSLLSNASTEYESTSLKSKKKSNILDCSNSGSGRFSPDMFCDSTVLENKINSPERDDLDVLASLVGKTTVHVEDSSINLNRSYAFQSTNLESNKKSDSMDFSNSDSGRRSPDMFCDSSVIQNKINSPERDDLDILASLVGKTTVEVDDSSINLDKSYAFGEAKDSSNPLSLSGASVKRKAVSSSLSDDENASSSKKLCTDLLSKTNISEHTNKEEILDLTQSSNSSKPESPNINQAELEDNSDECKIISPAGIYQDDYTDNLTQKNPSPPNSPILSPQQARGSIDSFSNVGPTWDGYDDDYWYYNYEHNSPMKANEKSLEKTLQNTSMSKSRVHVNVKKTPSPKTSSGIKYISSDSKSPGKSSKKNFCQSPNSVSRIKSLSSNDESSSNCVQKTLDYYISPHKTEDRYSVSQSVVNKEQDHSSKDKCFKTKKNLSLQFDTIRDEDKPPCLNTEDDQTLSPVQSISNSPKFEKDKSSQTPITLRKDSLAAMQRLLDDTFEINDSILVSAEALSSTPGDKSTGNKCPSPLVLTNANQMTPPPEIYVSDKVTPLPNYSGMKTPALKKELNRFGLKPSLGKSKAKLLLRHIYEQTHPFVPEPSSQTTAFKQPEGLPPRSPVKLSQEIHATVHLTDSESETEESCSQNSTCSSMSSSATLPEERLIESEEELLTQAQSSEDVHTSIRNVITSNPELHTKILMYEPIFLEDLKTMLKKKGIKCKSDKIIGFLDEQCITFRTTSWKARNEKRRQKHNLKNAKEKVSVGECSKNNYTSNVQSGQMKKRGRPRKLKNRLNSEQT